VEKASNIPHPGVHVPKGGSCSCRAGWWPPNSALTETRRTRYRWCRAKQARVSGERKAVESHTCAAHAAGGRPWTVVPRSSVSSGGLTSGVTCAAMATLACPYTTSCIRRSTASASIPSAHSTCRHQHHPPHHRHHVHADATLYERAKYTHLRDEHGACLLVVCWRLHAQPPTDRSASSWSARHLRG
jgi:hypothetical protein